MFQDIKMMMSTRHQHNDIIGLNHVDISINHYVQCVPILLAGTISYTLTSYQRTIPGHGSKVFARHETRVNRLQHVSILNNQFIHLTFENVARGRSQWNNQTTRFRTEDLSVMNPELYQLVNGDSRIAKNTPPGFEPGIFRP